MTTEDSRTVALVVAAGRGSRAGGDLPKQYATLGKEAVLTRTLRQMLEHPAISDVLAVIHPDDKALYEQATEALHAKLLPAVSGGATRQASVLSGLRSLSARQPDFVLIHDAARPFVSRVLITTVVEALRSHVACIPAIAVSDTLKRVSADGVILETVDRSDLFRAQTPQGFRYSSILEAHEAAAAAQRDDLTDDASVCQWAGIPVFVVPGANANIKLTTAEDIRHADVASRGGDREYRMEPRTGTGFDVHRLVEGDHVWLCGVRIPHQQGLEGHSDADVGLHAITDALLGAIGDGDIGQHFPPSDPRWKGARSSLFLADAARRVREAGGRIVNVDCTLMCEAPRIGPYRDSMRQAVADALGIPVKRVGIKATTTEKLGFTGRREGIAAMASALVLLPCDD